MEGLTHPVVWMNPYIDNTNQTIAHVTALNAEIDGQVLEQSALEVYAIARVIRNYMDRPNFDIRHVMILTSYNAQLDLIHRGLHAMLPELFQEEGGRPANPCDVDSYRGTRDGELVGYLQCRTWTVSGRTSR